MKCIMHILRLYRGFCRTGGMMVHWKKVRQGLLVLVCITTTVLMLAAGLLQFVGCIRYRGAAPYVFWRISADKQHGQHGRFDCCKIVLPGGRILYFRMGERAGFQKRCFYCNKGMQPCKAMACITKFPFSKNPRYDTILQEMKTQRKAEPER